MVLEMRCSDGCWRQTDVSVKHSLVRIAGHLSDNHEIDHGSDNKITG